MIMGASAARGKQVLFLPTVSRGGNTDFGAGNTNDVWSTSDGRSWQRLADGPWSARGDFGVAADDQIYLAGGQSS